MPAQYTAQKLRSRLLARVVSFAPGGVNPTIVDLVPGSSDELIPIKDLAGNFAAVMTRITGTGNTDAFEIIVATDADGTGATVVVAHAAPTGQNAVGDQLVLECDVDQMREVLATATHVGVRAELATGTDVNAVAVIAETRFQYSGLTADFIS